MALCTIIDRAAVLWRHAVARYIDDPYTENSASKAADELATAARKIWTIRGGGYIDDITAVVVKLY